MEAGVKGWIRFRSNSLARIFYRSQGFPSGAVVKNLPANTGDMGPGRSHMPRSN